MVAAVNTTVVIMLASIPYSPPFHIFLPADCIFKTAVILLSLPLKFNPRKLYKKAFQNECKPQAAQMFLKLKVKSEKMIEMKIRLAIPIIP